LRLIAGTGLAFPARRDILAVSLTILGSWVQNGERRLLWIDYPPSYPEVFRPVQQRHTMLPGRLPQALPVTVNGLARLYQNKRLLNAEAHVLISS